MFMPVNFEQCLQYKWHSAFNHSTQSSTPPSPRLSDALVGSPHPLFMQPSIMTPVDVRGTVRYYSLPSLVGLYRATRRAAIRAQVWR